MGAPMHGRMQEFKHAIHWRSNAAFLGLLACIIMQQCTVAAALTQADDATALLQFQQQYGFTALDWVGNQPCGLAPGMER